MKAGTSCANYTQQVSLQPSSSSRFSHLVLVGSGASGEEPPSEDQHIQDLQAALQKLPKVHLLVLDTIVRHLKGYVFYPSSTSQ